MATRTPTSSFYVADDGQRRDDAERTATNIRSRRSAPDGTWLMSSSAAPSTATRRRARTPSRGALSATQPSRRRPAGLVRRRLPDLLARRQAPGVQLLGVDGRRDDGRREVARRRSTRSGDQDVHQPAPSCYTPATGVASWSSFLPTNDAVVFENETRWRLGGTRSASRGYGNTGGSSWWVDLATQDARTRSTSSNGMGYLPTTRGGTHRRRRRAAQLRADGEPGRLRRLRVGGVHQPPPLRQRGHDRRRSSAIRATTTGTIRRSHDEEAVGGGDRSERARPAPIRATRRSICRRRSSSPATRAASGPSIPATPTAPAARRATSAAAATADPGGDGGALICTDAAADVLAGVREVHQRRRLLRRRRRDHVHQRVVLEVVADSVTTSSSPR